jgi:DNA-binding response OmpR family regulator
MPKRILVVDDESRVLAVIRRRLESVGYEVITAQDGAEGLDKARYLNPDLILLDVILPKMDGYEVCKQLKRDESLRHIPVLMLTGRSEEGDIHQGMITGADGYVTKPFQHEYLLSRIAEALDRAEQETAVRKAQEQERRIELQRKEE